MFPLTIVEEGQNSPVQVSLADSLLDPRNGQDWTTWSVLGYQVGSPASEAAWLKECCWILAAKH